MRCVLLLLLRAATGSRSGGYHQATVYRRLGPPPPTQCYSCMNMAFKHHWHKLQYFYYPQRNFTDDCVEMRHPEWMPTVPCAHSLCISLFEPRYIAGYFAGHNVVRGCLSGLFQFGYQRMAGQIDALMGTGGSSSPSGREFCSTTSATEIFPPVRGTRPTRRPATQTVAARPIKYCVCVGTACNTFVTRGVSALTPFCALILLLLTLQLLP